MSDTLDPVLGLWVYNLSRPVTSVQEWAALIADELRQASIRGAALLVLPEYISEAWIHFAPDALGDDQEVGWMADQASLVLPLLQKAVDETGVGLVAGSMPWRVVSDAKPHNRCWTLLPGQEPVPYDKMALIPEEDEEGGWELGTGRVLRPFTWRGVKYGVVVCLDVELPYLSWMLADQDIDVLLVPSLTAKMSGYGRVFSCAKARAVELFCAVAVTGCIGGANTPWRKSSNVSGAAVYLPCEEKLGSTGVFVQTEPRKDGEGTGEVVYTDPVPVSLMRELRREGAEVWPGKWSGGKRGVSIVSV